MLVLRDYQESLMAEMKLALYHFRHILVVLSTGGGKTALAAFMALGAMLKGKRIIFCCHRDFLLEQTAAAFDNVEVAYTFVAPGFTYNPYCNVVIASIDTLKRRLDIVKAPDVLIVDEAVHAAAAGWAKVIEHYQAQGCMTVGLAACPERLSGKGLGAWFKKIVQGPTMGWLIEHGYLSPYKLFAPSSPDISTFHTRGGEYNKEEVENAMNRPSVTGNAIVEYSKIAAGKQGVAFCCSIKHSLSVRDQFIGAGYSAVHIGSDTSKDDRKGMLKDFRAGKITILTSVDIFSEGFDLPAVEYGALLRPTKSLNIYMQQCGRLLRASPGKQYAFIADHAANCREHGLPCDERQWTLEDRKKGGGGGERSVPVKMCESCFFCHHPAPSCPNCGHVYPIEYRQIKEVEGELSEVEIAAAKKSARMEVGKAKSISDLKKIADERGYAQGWVFQMARVKGIKHA
jgi:superfamily II DNA or RNA helicase